MKLKRKANTFFKNMNFNKVKYFALCQKFISSIVKQIKFLSMNSLEAVQKTSRLIKNWIRRY